eukprot:TRINITY_DN45440_c0_g1_i1.p1 TRINITY_DN45440_c0_g1~~TRINITY_DN45440_c0_g1_i1.p1  ORF type:complete len:225 (+),score=52.86 TRINITY_DN45440_c0_g1_i1:75-677(+)
MLRSLVGSEMCIRDRTKHSMVLFSQLVCNSCRRILTYPLGAISCRCRQCHQVTPSMHLEIVCENCETTLLLPINTLTGLCPCCFTVTHVPIEMLPNIEEPVVLEGEDEVKAAGKSVYVQHLTQASGSAASSSPSEASPPTQKGKVSVATELRLERLVREQAEAAATAEEGKDAEATKEDPKRAKRGGSAGARQQAPAARR